MATMLQGCWELPVGAGGGGAGGCCSSLRLTEQLAPPSEAPLAESGVPEAQQPASGWRQQAVWVSVTVSLSVLSGQGWSEKDCNLLPWTGC